MATIFGHALVAGTASWCASNHKKLLLWCCVSSMLPDADIIGFSFHVNYNSFWGHRGFSHSLLFAFLWALFAQTFIFYKSAIFSKKGLTQFVLLFVSTASHGVLDGLTTGGLGVAFFSPFDNTRYFLPWQFIKVSPIGAGKFLSQRGLNVLKNEGLFIGVPCLVALTCKSGYLYLRKKK